MKTRSNNRIRRSISTRFMFISFIIFFFISLLATCGRIWIDFVHTKASVFESLKLSQKVYEDGLSRAIWFMDEDYLESEIKGIMENPHLTLVLIQGDKNQHYLFEKKSEEASDMSIGQAKKDYADSGIQANEHSRLVRHEFVLMHTAEDGESYTLGKAVFATDKHIIFQKLKYKISLAITNIIVLLIALGIIIYYTGGRILTKPLGQLTTAIQTFDPDTPDRSLNLSLFQGNDELETVARAFSAMQSRLIDTVSSLRKNRAELMELTRNLETIVENRTAELTKSNIRLENEIHERKELEVEREKLIAELRKTLAEVKTLGGLLPICSSCKNIRDDKGYWNQIETYIREHSDADFSHGICPDCAKKYYPELDLYK